MNNPSLKFKSDYRVDVEIFKGFFNSHKADPSRNYLESCFFKHYPKLIEIFKNSKTDFPEKEVLSFVRNKHQKDKMKIEERLNGIRVEWEDVENDFYNLIDLIFKKHSWPKGDYIGFASIWGIFLRNLESKKFSFPYGHPVDNFALSVVMHEMIHFIFFDYVFENYPNTFGEMNPNRGILWSLSEIFNAIILSTPEFIELHGLKKINSGTLHIEHRNNLSYLKKIWNDYKEIDAWLVEAGKHLKDQQV